MNCRDMTSRNRKDDCDASVATLASCRLVALLEDFLHNVRRFVALESLDNPDPAPGSIPILVPACLLTFACCLQDDAFEQVESRGYRR